MAGIMKGHRSTILWLVGGSMALAVLAWAYPRVYPLFPGPWEITRAEAETLALERLRDLGEPVDDPYVVVRLRGDVRLERRLQLLASVQGAEVLAGSEPAGNQVVWDVLVYPPRANPGEWTYRAWIGLDGRVQALRRQSPGDGGGDEPATPTPSDDELVARARGFLEAQGYDLSIFAPEPEIHTNQAARGTRSVVRFASTDALLGPEIPWGTAVHFEGAEPRGFAFWYDDQETAEIDRVFRQAQLLGVGRMVFFYLLLPLVAVPFLRRYHDGQLGVRRGIHLALFSLGCGLLIVVLGGRVFSEGTNIGFLDRRQTTWLIGGFVLVFQSMGLAVLGLMSWSVGEFWCRQRWPQKLAALDAVFRGKWGNATVARSALRGTLAGIVLVALTFVLACLGQGAGVWAVAGLVLGGNGLDGPLPVLALVAGVATYFLPLFLFTYLLVPCWACQRLGTVPGILLSMVLAAIIVPAIVVLPLEIGWPMALVLAAGPVLLFRFGDLFSALIAGLVGQLAIFALPALLAADPVVQSHGLGALLVAALPMLVSLRHLAGGEEFRYTWDDVPPHVRRIAERERQRVELETARNIQSSILPELPPQLGGVAIAHSYLPASEVGGDFYDVLALEDGRLAVAVGDVAGHGVSSGLVMSMARSALAVQVTFDPRVEAVFATLNRMVFQSARRRLLSTLCYAILDPAERQLLYASAGHVFPYRVSVDGEVDPLHAESYPLGVRPQIEVRVRATRLEAGDSIFLYSDGLVEATVDGGDEPFGFERLEESLRRHAGKSPEQLRDAVLDDVQRFTHRQLHEDDLTVLVLQLPL